MDFENVNPDSIAYLEEDAYAVGTPLDDLFPESPKANVLAALISESEKEFNESQLEDVSGVEGAAEHAEYLADELGLVDAEDGSYTINMEHPGAELVAELEGSLLEHSYDYE